MARKRNLTHFSGQYPAACKKNGAMSCPNSSEVALLSLLITSAQRLGVFQCSAMLSVSWQSWVCLGSLQRNGWPWTLTDNLHIPKERPSLISSFFSCFSISSMSSSLDLVLQSQKLPFLPRGTVHPLHGWNRWWTQIVILPHYLAAVKGKITSTDSLHTNGPSLPM